MDVDTFVECLARKMDERRRITDSLSGVDADSWSEVAHRHCVSETIDREQQKGDFILLRRVCERTGRTLHWHSMQVCKKLGNERHIASEHSAHGDGMLSYPVYYGFLTRLIETLEADHPDVFIVIQPCLLTCEAFYDKEHE